MRVEYTSLLYNGLSEVRNSEYFSEEVIWDNTGVLDSFELDLQFLNEMKFSGLTFRGYFPIGHEFNPLFLVSFHHRRKQAL